MIDKTKMQELLSSVDVSWMDHQMFTMNTDKGTRYMCEINMYEVTVSLLLEILAELKQLHRTVI